MKWLTYNLFVFQNTYNLEQPKLVHSGETIMFEITDTQLVELEVVLISLSQSLAQAIARYVHRNVT